MKPKRIHFIEDEFHRYAIVFEAGNGKLATGPWGIEPVSVADHVETMKEEYPEAVVYVEKYSGEAPVDPEPIDEPYPHPKPRKALV